MWLNLFTQKMCNTMSWISIKTKSSHRYQRPYIRIKDDYIYLSQAGYDLLCRDKSSKGTYLVFLENDESKGVYISQSDDNNDNSIRFPAKSKGVKADLLVTYLQGRFGKEVKKLSIDGKSINRQGNKTFILKPIKNGK